MKAEYNALMGLKSHPGYQVLLALWALQHEKILNAMRKAGKGGKEASWRYYAGQMEGFEIAIMQLERSLKDMEKEDENLESSREAEKQVEELLRKVKGDKA